MNTKYVVFADDLLRMFTFSSRDETRYYLGGVNLRPATKGVFLEASDGSRAGLLKMDTGIAPDSGAPLIVSGDKNVIATLKRREKIKSLHWAVIDPEAQRLSIVVANESTEALVPEKSREIASVANALIVDGVFPNLGNVLPTKVAVAISGPICINPLLLADFAKMSNEKTVHTVLFNDANNDDLLAHQRAMIIRVSGRPDFVGVLMPAKSVYTLDEALPRWLPKKPPKDVADKAA